MSEQGEQGEQGANASGATDRSTSAWRHHPAPASALYVWEMWTLTLGESEVAVYQSHRPEALGTPKGAWLASVRLGAGAAPHVVVLRAGELGAAQGEAVGLLSTAALEQIVRLKAVARACNALLAGGAHG